MKAIELRAGMIIREGRIGLRVLETPFPCSPRTKIHAKVERPTKDGNKTEMHCYDRMAEVEVNG